jgi:xylulokinase
VATGDDCPIFVAVDLGTSGARAVAVDLEGKVVLQVRRPYRTSTPAPGIAEQDPRDWIRCGLEALTALAARGHLAGRVRAVGLTGQCPTVAPFGPDGQALGPGMLYRDNRAVAEAEEMRARIGVEAMHRQTGHVAEAFHVGPKVLWLRRHRPDVFASAARFLQPRDVILHALTGEYLTDQSHADATLFFDLQGRRWSPDLFAAFDLPPSLFPDALPSRTVVGSVTADVGLPPDVPVVLGAGDSQCATFGAGVVGPGPVSEMAGSSSCLNSVVEEPLTDLAVSHYSHVVPGLYTTEMGLNTSGAATGWAVKRLGYGSYRELEADALRFAQRRQRIVNARETAPLFLPYLGDGDRDDPNVRASFQGLSLRHDRPALAYSVLEGVAMGVRLTLEVLQQAGSPLDELRVSGGGARLSLLGQLKANVLNRDVLHLNADAAATGTAMLAASVTGWEQEAGRAIQAILNRARRFEPDDRWVEIEAERLGHFRRARETAP